MSIFKNLPHNDRVLNGLNFKDLSGESCIMQDSSLSGSGHIKLGPVSGNFTYLNKKKVDLLIHSLQTFVNGEKVHFNVTDSNGRECYAIGYDFMYLGRESGRMKLNKEMVVELIAELEYFVKNGHIRQL